MLAKQGRIDWVHLLFSSAGRMPRAPFLLAVLLLIAVWAAYDHGVTGIGRALTGWIVVPALLISGASLLSKRLHDRGRRGWWAAIPLWAFVVVWPSPDGLIDFAFTLVLIVSVMELGLAPGEPSANRFGPPPKAARAR